MKIPDPLKGNVKDKEFQEVFKMIWKIVLVICMIIVIVVAVLLAVENWVKYEVLSHCIGVYFDVLKVNEMPLDEIANIEQILEHDIDEVVLCALLIHALRGDD